ncbi:BCCT family transporter [Bacillus sonorensis]|uniref:glycine betaine transporter OpuD n=1 Tax=Bacillus TaxID=1386 RepID=UPI0004985115|nr:MULTISPECIES: BCCT family transporter [Bacillus]MCF7617200.1 BCCT family transporter [Bacillus sonorensis]MCY7859142.1 BCCT family transporter [Bacillus sonorensis]MCY8027075.1 BCCT family transporter [Bacillus sonorensis]MCY8033968.1 BCCT family transporter [Bacillus sonorensis]MCY8089781.1 BCCT family transporter [Bacillus sonorensis]
MLKNISSVFWIVIVITAAAVLWGIIAPDNLQALSSSIQEYLTNTFGWYYLLVVSLFVAFGIFLMFSPIGKIKLGKPDEKPEFSLLSWFAMLFSAGMGIGLVFYGAAEPISHFAISSPSGETETAQAFRDSLRFTFFHWGLHAWAIYAIVALCIAYFKFRKDAPGLISATLYPVFGDRVKGPLGKLIDCIAVFATVVGVATSLGIGATQINGGLNYLFNIPNNFQVQLIIIAIVTVLFLASAWSGISKGIKYLSNINMGLAGILMLFMLFAGPTVLIMNSFTDTIGTYFSNLVQMSFRLSPINEEGRQWINSWTIFYWAWWISWSPFVGIFIARVSRGRTIREFLGAVLFAPSLLAFLWFSIFGVSAMNLQQNDIFNVAKLSTETMLFGTLNHYPLQMITSIVALILIAVFFITSADSATFVLGMQTTYGSLNPANSVKVSWGIIQSAMAAALLYSGGLTALQNTAILAALPFSIVIIFMIVSLYKSLSKERRELKKTDAYQKPRSPRVKKA